RPVEQPRRRARACHRPAHRRRPWRRGRRRRCPRGRCLLRHRLPGGRRAARPPGGCGAGSCPADAGVTYNDACVTTVSTRPAAIQGSEGPAMEKFTTLRGVAAPLPMINVDNDMIIPKQYLKTIKRTGIGTNLFDELRYQEDGREKPDFVLNQPAYRKAQILVAGENFT